MHRSIYKDKSLPLGNLVSWWVRGRFIEIYSVFFLWPAAVAITWIYKGNLMRDMQRAKRIWLIIKGGNHCLASIPTSHHYFLLKGDDDNGLSNLLEEISTIEQQQGIDFLSISPSPISSFLYWRSNYCDPLLIKFREKTWIHCKRVYLNYI